MNWKEFFKPTIVKVVLFLILMGGLNYYIISTSDVLDARELFGSPLGFWPIGSFYVQAGGPTPPVVEFSWTNFIIDIVFWYLVSCVLVAVYHKFKKK